MIESIRRTLIIRYTLVIAVILSLGFAASYAAYRHNGIKLLHDSLHDYLTEEVWEAGEFLNKYNGKTEIHKIKSDIKSLHNFTYWTVDGKIVHAERPENDVIAEQLEHRLLINNYESGKIYHENIKNNNKKWYFIVAKQDLSPEIVQNGKVFVLANYTPVRKNAKAYIKIAFLAVGIMIILSYLLGSYFAARSMIYIERSYEKQKKFVSDAAHELRTPLAILYSYAELSEYNPHKKDIISDIKNEIQQMNDLVDTLLSIARYDASTVVLQKEVFSLNEIVLDSIRSMRQLYPSAVFVFNGADANIEQKADKVMIRQLLSILLDNAIKYTNDDKKIVIELYKHPSNIEIVIKDNGIGIKKEDLPFIFDRFWRAETSRHRKSLGLGLSIADIIVKLHKGFITVDSEIGNGTTFKVTLPSTCTE